MEEQTSEFRPSRDVLHGQYHTSSALFLPRAVASLCCALMRTRNIKRAPHSVSMVLEADTASCLTPGLVSGDCWNSSPHSPYELTNAWVTNCPTCSGIPEVSYLYLLVASIVLLL